MEKSKLTVIIPFYNESSELIKQTIKRIKKFLSERKIVYEIIVSQNGKDKPIPHFDKKIIFIFDKNKGLGLAIKNAVREARGDYFYFLPADVPFNFTDLKAMLKLFSSFDFIFGSKLHPESIYQINLLRKFSTLFQQKISAFFLPKLPVKDTNGTYFGNLKTTKGLILATKSNDFFFGTELLYTLNKHNFKIKEVPVVYKKLNSKSTVNLVKDGFNYLKQLLQLYIQT